MIDLSLARNGTGHPRRRLPFLLASHRNHAPCPTHTVARLRLWKTEKLPKVALFQKSAFSRAIPTVYSATKTMVADGCGWLRSPQLRWLRHGCGGGVK